MAASTGSAYNVYRDHAWNIFGEDDPEAQHEAVASQAARSKDLFMGELSAVLSGAIRHAVAPPSATWRHTAGYLHNTATPYAKEVHFTLYLISDSGRRGGGGGSGGGGSGASAASGAGATLFDVDAFEAELKTLVLKSQEFRFSRQALRMADDPLLAAAFATSLKTATQQARPSLPPVPHCCPQLLPKYSPSAAQMLPKCSPTAAQSPVSAAH